MIIVADKEDRTGVHPVREQQVCSQGSTQAVVFHDVAEQKAVSELVGSESAKNLDVEHGAVVARVMKTACDECEVRIQPGHRSEGREDGAGDRTAQEWGIAIANLVSPTQEAASGEVAACPDPTAHERLGLEEFDTTESFHVTVEVGNSNEIVSEGGLQANACLFVLQCPCKIVDPPITREGPPVDDFVAGPPAIRQVGTEAPRVYPLHESCIGSEIGVNSVHRSTVAQVTTTASVADVGGWSIALGSFFVTMLGASVKEG